jgi:hypothetical protein
MAGCAVRRDSGSLMKVDGAVTIDLRLGDEYAVMRAVQTAAYAPTGAHVEFIVEPNQWPPFQGVQYLREHGKHLGRIAVKCADPVTVRRWIFALRGEDQ